MLRYNNFANIQVTFDQLVFASIQVTFGQPVFASIQITFASIFSKSISLYTDQFWNHGRPLNIWNRRVDTVQWAQKYQNIAKLGHILPMLPKVNEKNPNSLHTCMAPCGAPAEWLCRREWRWRRPRCCALRSLFALGHSLILEKIIWRVILIWKVELAILTKKSQETDPV